MRKNWRSRGTSWTKLVRSSISRPNWECMSVHRKQGLFLSVYMDDIKMAGKKQNMAPMWKNWWNMLILLNPHHFFTMCTWDALSVNANRMKHYWTTYDDVWSTYFCWSNRKITGMRKTSRTNGSVVPRHGGICSKMRRAVWGFGKREKSSSKTMFQVFAWMITNHSNLLETCLKFGHKLSCIACAWHELTDLIFYGPWTYLLVLSPSGPEPVTDAWQGWFLTFITRTTSDSVVMWETGHSIVDWGCFKTQPLLEIMRTRNQPQEVSCVLWSVNELARSVTKWTQACDRRLARLISHIHHTNDFRQYCQVGNTAQHGFVSRLRFCCRSWRLEINLTGSPVYFWKQNICPSRLDVQETDFSFACFHRGWNCFSRCRIAYGSVTCSRSLGHGDWSVTFY